MEITPALIISGISLILSMTAVYFATRVKRKVQVVPPPHRHQWETINVCEISNLRHPLVGHLYTLRCKECGDIKRKRIGLNGED